MDGKVYVLNPAVRVCEFQDQRVLVNPANSEWIKLSVEAFELVENIEGLTVGELVTTACVRRGARCEDVRALLGYLCSAGFMVEEGHEERPGRIHFNITERCNLACPTCYFGAGGLPGNDALSTREVLAVLDALAEARPRSLVISGGEPFVRKDIREILDFVRGRFDDVLLLTNGCLIGAREAEWVRESGARVQVSVESDDPSVHDAVRGKGAFNAAIRGISALLSAGVDKIEIVPTLTRRNLPDIPGILRLAKSLGVGYHFSLFMPVGRGACHAADLSIPPRELLSCLASLITQASRGSGDHAPGLESCAPIDLRAKAGCGAGHGVLSVGPEGVVYPCPLMHRPDMYLGRLPDDSLSKMRRSGRNVVPDVTRVPGCSRCDVAYFCGGGCRANALAQGGTVFSVDPYCEFYRAAFRAALWGWREDRSADENVKTVVAALVDGL
ncbi:MAG: radical SAM protein [Firmicutes bacterium]|jgi:radical SAM protein with 4Fe4S-binding SPASM domain|nr:radical SAM protein [Bacillota bacterium]MDH7496061.1 radical SAM protein [Bacillota bacterium]